MEFLSTAQERPSLAAVSIMATFYTFMVPISLWKPDHRLFWAIIITFLISIGIMCVLLVFTDDQIKGAGESSLSMLQIHKSAKLKETKDQTGAKTEAPYKMLLECVSCLWPWLLLLLFAALVAFLVVLPFVISVRSVAAICLTVFFVLCIYVFYRFARKIHDKSEHVLPSAQVETNDGSGRAHYQNIHENEEINFTI